MKFVLFVFLLFLNVFPSDAQNDLDRAQDKWISFLNAGKPELAAEMYISSGHLMLDGELVTGKEEISRVLNNLVNPRLKATYGNHYKHTDKAFFHLHKLDSPEGKWHSTVAWKYVNGEWMKELEVIHRLRMNGTGFGIDLDIKAMRNLWEEYSNSHNHKQLVKLMYTEDAWYINNGKTYQGHEAISKKYAYMSRPTWQIELLASRLEFINDNLAMETGQYTSNGIGHYIILWRKVESGLYWKVALDFNF